MTYLLAAVAVVLLSVLSSHVHAQSASAPVDVVWNGRVQGDVVMSGNGRYVAFVVDTREVRVVDRQTREVSVVPATALHPPAYAYGGGVMRVFTISDDGRYLTYRVGYDGLYRYAIFGRLDRTTGAVTTLALESALAQPPVTFYGARSIAASRDGRTVAWFDATSAGSAPDTPRVLALLPGVDAPVVVGRTCTFRSTYARNLCASGPAVTGDGRFILYTSGVDVAEALALYDTATTARAARAYYPEAVGFGYYGGPSPYVTGASGRFIGVRGGASTERTHGIFDRTRRVLDPLTEAPGRDPLAISDDGGLVLLDGFPAAVVDRRSGIVLPLPLTVPHALSADGTHVLGTIADAESGATDLRVIALDADGDGMLDGWERHFGVDPTTAADGALDADGDGVTNAAEFAARSHPTAVASATRLFAEGAGGGFFDTLVSVFNPGDAERQVVVRFLPPAGTAGASRTLRLPAKARADLASCCLPPLEATEFAIVVESDGPIVADRRMTWDRVAGYGSHASTGVGAPASTWYFAEGATIAGLQTFFLLQNPGRVDGIAEIEYLLANGTQVTRAYQVPAGTRQTVWVNQEGATLGAAEFAAVVRTSVPMVAERALYRDAAGQVFAAGTNAIGATALASRWFFAEGTTRAGFDTFVLLANPSDAPVTVHATFAGATGTGALVSVARTYTVAARSRLTVWADQEDPMLADADISTTLDATAPIVAERAMWWRTNGPEWIEGHVEFGATETGTAFAIADGSTLPVSSIPPAGGTPTQTYVLVGVPDAAPAMLRVTAYPSAGGPVVREFATAGQRTTISMGQSFPSVAGSYSIIVESLPVNGVPTPIVVERAIYSSGRAAGAAARAARLQ